MKKVFYSDKKGHSILTTHRIRQKYKFFGNLRVTSIMLEEVSSCEYKRTSRPLYLAISLVLALCMYYVHVSESSRQLEELIQVLFILSIIFLLLYVFSFENLLYVASSSAKVTLRTKGMNNAGVIAFIDMLEGAKDERCFKQNRTNSN